MKFLTKARRNLEIIILVLTCAAFLIVPMSVLPKYLIWHPLSRSREPSIKMFFVPGNEVVVAALGSMVSPEGQATSHVYRQLLIINARRTKIAHEAETTWHSE